MAKFKSVGIRGENEGFEGGEAVQGYPALLIMFYLSGEEVGTKVFIILFFNVCECLKYFKKCVTRK